MITNRPVRLSGFDYRGFHRYFLTMCTANRSRLFESADVVNGVGVDLKRAAADHKFEIYGYCFMPDHLHALCAGASIEADFQRFVKAFKQASGFRYKRLHLTCLWQPGYHERILRDEEQTETVLRYIWENPIRAGLAEELGEYPHCGSDLFDVAAMRDLWFEKRT